MRSGSSSDFVIIEIQNHSGMPVYFSSLSLNLSGDRNVAVMRDGIFELPLKARPIAPGDSFKVHLEAERMVSELGEVPTGAFMRDAIDRDFRAPDGEVEAAFHQALAAQSRPRTLGELKARDAAKAAPAATNEAAGEIGKPGGGSMTNQAAIRRAFEHGMSNHDAMSLAFPRIIRPEPRPGGQLFKPPPKTRPSPEVEAEAREILERVEQAFAGRPESALRFDFTGASRDALLFVEAELKAHGWGFRQIASGRWEIRRP